ncbi:hypothetical protein Q3O59_08120 [Alkalimonas delamerensis]|uniref:Chromosome segregation ATPase n=1 Tax=Alkalimonas delamerensis TaxID=265981 RepID=A0ABT9GPU0_9GAMM|nr:hypothetical protein [Alkalimonas delamerensis]MDP4528993.1 hypothetical protein [Alkalimonas delamerensis]
MKLVLSCMETPWWNTLQTQWPDLTKFEEIPPTLSANGLIPATANFEQLATLVQRDDVSALLVFFVQAEHAIAQAIQQGDSLQQACDSWLAQATALTNLHRKNRKKIRLVNLHQALQFPLQLQAQLHSMQLDMPAFDATSPETTMELLLSCQAVRQHEELQRLNTLLQASALPLAENEQPELNIEALQQQQAELQANLKQQQEDAKQLKADLQSSQQENELLVQQRAELQANLKQQQEDAKQLKADLQSSQQENELLLQQLMAVQEELEKYFLQAKASNNELEANRKQLSQTKQQLANEKKSATALRKQQKKLEQSIQEQTRRHTLDVKTLQQKERELKKLQQEHKQLKADYAGVNYQLYQVSQEISAVKNSRLWKGSAPLRKLSQLVQRGSEAREQLQRDSGLLFTSEYFDADWYLATYPDVAEAGINPAEHYLQYGANEGRFPSLQFDGNWYLQRYPDVAKAGLNPLLHFIKHGQAEGRQVSPKLLIKPIPKSKARE